MFQVIWWKLFNAVDSSKWSNILAVIELLFCLPMANGHLERVFSQLKLIKTNRRISLKESTLDQLLQINTECPPLCEWDASVAMDLWWTEKTRRVNQKEPHSASTSVNTHQGDEQEAEHEVSFSLEDWEEWMTET